MTTTQPLLTVDMREVAALQRELRAVSEDFAKAVRTELRKPVADLTSDLKFSAKTRLPSYIAADAVSTISTQASSSGYAVRRRPNSRFSQDNYTDQKGAVRHPVFGNREVWSDTQIPGAQGWWSQMLAERLPDAVDDFTDTMQKILGRLASGNLSTTSTSRITKSGSTRSTIGL